MPTVLKRRWFWSEAVATLAVSAVAIFLVVVTSWRPVQISTSWPAAPSTAPATSIQIRADVVSADTNSAERMFDVDDLLSYKEPRLWRSERIFFKVTSQPWPADDISVEVVPDTRTLWERVCDECRYQKRKLERSQQKLTRRDASGRQ
jgi:hypothetical protein